MSDAAGQVLAHLVRGGLVESVHAGHAVVTEPAGAVVRRLGAPESTIYARSALKPLQAAAMVAAGLDVPAPLLALAAASHSGEPGHLEGVLALLAGAGLAESALRNTPRLPLGVAASRDWLAAGRAESALAADCSGKHAAMLATCVVAGWDVADYDAPGHPLQVAVRSGVEAATGDAATHVTRDGCGAPLLSCTLTGLARAFGALAHEAGPVASAMAGHPWQVAGTGREVTLLMQAVPGAVAKDGAEGVLAVGLADGTGLAVKVLDGASRTPPVVVVALLRDLGVDPGLPAVPVLGGDDVVGELVAVL